jgi:hypothetical protein
VLVAVLTWIFVAASRLRALLSARRLDSEPDAEILAHLDQLTHDNVRPGMSRDDGVCDSAHSARTPASYTRR